jgi:hypothetical protein
VQLEEIGLRALVLETSFSLESPGSLQLQLTVEATALPPALRATFGWGDYLATILIEDVQPPLPELPLAMVLDEAGDVRAGFCLSLELAADEQSMNSLVFQ